MEFFSPPLVVEGWCGSRLGICDFMKYWACMDFNDKTLCGKRLVLVKADSGSSCAGFARHWTARASTTT